MRNKNKCVLGFGKKIKSKIIKAWDPDFSKVTYRERKILEQADKEISEGIYYTNSDVWLD